MSSHDYRHSTDAATGYCRSVYLWLLRPLSHTTDIPQTLLLATAGQCIYGCYVHSAILQTFHRRCYWLLQVSVSMAATSTQPYYRHSTDAATGYYRSVYLRLLRPLSHTTDIPQTLLLATAGQCIYMAATSTQPYYRHSTDAATGYCRSVYLWLLRPLSYTTDIPQTLLLATAGQCIYGCYVHSAILQTFHRRCYWLLQVSLSMAATSTQPYYRHSTDAATGYCRSVYLWLLRPLSHTTDIPQTLLLATAGQCIYGCYVHSAILQTFHRRCYWLLQVSVSMAATSTQPYYRHSTDAATGYCRSVYLWLLRPLSHTTDIPQTLLLATAGQCIYGCYVHSAILQTFHRRCYWLLQVSLSTAATSTQPYYRHSTDAATGYCRSVYLRLLRPLSHTTDIPQTLLLATTGQCIYGCYVHSAILQTFHRRCYWLLQVSVSMAATSTQPYYRHSTDAATGYYRSVYLWLLRPLSHTMSDIPQTLLLATAGQCIYGCYVHSAILQTFHRRCYWLLQVSVYMAATSTQPYYRHSTDAATGYCRSVYLRLLRPLSHTTDIPQTLLLATAGQFIYGCYIHSAILLTGLDIGLVGPVARVASRFENLLAPQKTYWPPKKLTGPYLKTKLARRKTICINLQFAHRPVMKLFRSHPRNIFQI